MTFTYQLTFKYFSLTPLVIFDWLLHLSARCLEISSLKSELNRREISNMEIEEKRKSLLEEFAKVHEEKSKLENLLKACNARAQNISLSETDQDVIDRCGETNAKKYLDLDNVMTSSTCSNSRLYGGNSNDKSTVNGDEYSDYRNSTRNKQDFEVYKEQGVKNSRLPPPTWPKDPLMLTRGGCYAEANANDRSHRDAEESDVKNVNLMNFNEGMSFPRGSSEGIIEESTNSLHTNGKTWGKPRVVDSVLSSECRPITSSIISAPFATDSTRRELSTFDTIDKKLTEVIEQKKMLEEEQLK